MATPGARHPVPGLVSVIIPVRNGAGTIGEQLAALAAQTYQGATEVLVADNGSTDSTPAVVREWTARFTRLDVVDASARRGPAAARNAGARHAHGDLLAFCDADDVVAAGWLAAFVEQAHAFDIVAGPLEATELNALDVQSWRPSRATALPRGRFLPFAPSGNVAVWADVFRATGGFNEEFAQAEDLEWSWRAQLAGYTLGFAPDAVVHYRYRTSSRGIVRQAYVSGECAARLYREFRDRGMPKRPTPRALRTWLWVAVRLPYLLSPSRRGLWLRRAADSFGRLVGSARYRVVFL